MRSQRRDGWWEADNLDTGESGMIPSNFMRVCFCVLKFIFHTFLVIDWLHHLRFDKTRHKT